MDVHAEVVRIKSSDVEPLVLSVPLVVLTRRPQAIWAEPIICCEINKRLAS